MDAAPDIPALDRSALDRSALDRSTLDPAPPEVEQSVLDDLRSRLVATRRVPLSPGAGWDRGVDADYLTDLLDAWADYDWRPHEARLRALPWATAAGLRVVHQRAEPAGDGMPVVLLHGWPDSFLRFTKVLPLLTDLDVVVPCFPGYPYASADRPATSSAAMAEQIAESMAALGYQRYVVSGGDIGSSVAEQLAAAHPDRVAALHLTDIPYAHMYTVDPAELDDAGRGYLAAGQRWRLSEGAYALEHATKPHTLAVGLGDSPAGLAAWIVEKLRSWSDCGGDVESVFPREDLLTWITLYWVTGAIGTSFAPYAERSDPPSERIEVPTAVMQFPHDLVPAPRSIGERFFDLRSWVDQPDGGHFGAWERPEEFVAGLRTAVGLVV